MASDHGFKFDASKPALIVKYGNTTRKCRPLDKDVLLLGRAPGCDVGLEAPEVAPVHCVIARAADGWRLRDCSGRLATRLNGQSVHDELLHDTDVLQIGPFSFQVHLPPEHRFPAPVRVEAAPVRVEAAAPADEGRLRRAQRSRRNLAQLALALRQKLQLAGASAQAETARGDAALAARQEELDRLADALTALQRDVHGRLADVERDAKEVAAREAALQERHEQLERELAKRQADAEAALRGAREQFEERCRQAEQARPPAPEAADTTETARRLDLRARELAHYARGLLRARTRAQEDLVRERREAEAQHQQRREELSRSQAQLREQRTEVLRMLGEMRQLRQTARPASDPIAETLRQENEQLRRTLAGRDREHAAALEQAEREAARQREEADAFRLLRAAPAADRPAATDETPRPESDGALEALRREIQVRDATIEELYARLEAGGGAEGTDDQKAYEEELNQFRLELEKDRHDLDEQLRQIRERYAEMEQTTREAEVQITRERAQLVRERLELSRLKEESRREQPPRERSGVRDGRRRSGVTRRI